MTSLSGKTILMSGGSRGIGLAIAVTAAGEGANVALLAKTGEPHPRLEGTVFTAAEQIEAAGGQALPLVGDVRQEPSVDEAVARTVERFGGIDVCLNNASAIDVSGTEALDLKRFDLMQAINVRGTFALSRACIPHLRSAPNPHILTLSPPLTTDPAAFAPFVGYTMAKFAMSICALGLAEELRRDGIASNTLWPRTMVATDAIKNLFGGDKALARSRSPQLYADAAVAILRRDSRSCTGHSFLCEDVMVEEGVGDLDRYACRPGERLRAGLWVDGPDPRPPPRPHSLKI